MSQPLASIGDRFTGQFVDGLIAIAFGAAVYYVAKSLGLPVAPAVVAWLAYLLLCDGLPGGQSIGKRLTHSSVVHVYSGLPCTYWRSIVRNLSLLVLGVLDALFILGAQRRRLGDHLAGTKVVRTRTSA